MQSGSLTVGADEWVGRTGDSWAAEWRRTDRSFSVLTERLLQRSREFRCASVLDIGCGAAELSLAIARGRPKSRIVGVDISPQLIDVARDRGAQLGNATFEQADAATWRPAEPFAPDLLVSRHGVMFFADPVAAFSNLAATSAPEAGLLFSCFRSWEENPAFTAVARLLPVPPPPPAADAPGPFGFSDPARVEEILARAGWTEIAFESLDFPMVVGAGDDPVEDTCGYFSLIGPAARALREIDENARTAFFAQLRDLARQNERDGVVALRAAAWIVTARRG